VLEVKNLTVEVSSKIVLKDVNLSIDKGEVMILFGPNGSGKSSLIKTILGLGGYKVMEGEVILDGKSLNGLSTDERVKLGLGIMYQNPPKIRGVRLNQISKYLCKDEARIGKLADELSLHEHMGRDINLDFSGGEVKRSELFQVSLQDPAFALIDEPESGVDLENISIMGGVLNKYLKKKEKSALIITHTGYILDYIDAKKGCLMIDGQLWCSGRPPKEMFEEIKDRGYGYCRECHGRK
jgi:Fe-S cluster assembly ATP-binding protein